MCSRKREDEGIWKRVGAHGHDTWFCSIHCLEEYKHRNDTPKIDISPIVQPNRGQNLHVSGILKRPTAAPKTESHANAFDLLRGGE